MLTQLRLCSAQSDCSLTFPSLLPFAHRAQIRPEQALAALEARLEADELLAFQQQTERRIQQPQQEYGQFVQRLLTPFSVQLSRDGPYGRLHAEAQQLTNTLQVCETCYGSSDPQLTFDKTQPLP